MRKLKLGPDPSITVLTPEQQEKIAPASVADIKRLEMKVDELITILGGAGRDEQKRSKVREEKGGI